MNNNNNNNKRRREVSRVDRIAGTMIMIIKKVEVGNFIGKVKRKEIIIEGLVFGFLKEVKVMGGRDGRAKI